MVSSRCWRSVPSFLKVVIGRLSRVWYNQFSQGHTGKTLRDVIFRQDKGGLTVISFLHKVGNNLNKGRGGTLRHQGRIPE